MDKRDKEYYRELKAIQNEYTPPKWDRRKPYDWKKEWGPFLKYDSDWYAEDIVKVILYKLEKTYIGMDNYSDEWREDLDKKLKTLRETIDLGKKILNYDYDSEYCNWSKEHCAHTILIFKADQSLKEEPIHKFVFWRKDDEDDENPMESFFHTKEVDDWLKRNGLTRKEIKTVYSGEWDTEENQKIHRELVKKAVQTLQKDRDKFFKLISRNYFHWGW